ncbi:hypothetical protein AURDEDRAFT_115820 [Auricularia subglabra TFB-10046 SS5]|nr:hypothetical protein AURDEDRAFT_115820 [Auricularia subglabra TFB-10046 SS5]
MELDTARAAVYDYIQTLLTSGAKQESPSTHIDKLVETIRSAVHDACADFAVKWNNERAGLALERLPAELLTMCFRKLWFYDLVSVSHVSRKWRAAALADSVLWTTFSRTDPGNIKEQSTRKMIAQLTTMLERSRPSPFTLRLPRTADGFHLLEEYVTDVVGPELARIQLYDGSFEIYDSLNQNGADMPHLESLTLFTKSWVFTPVWNLPPTWGSTGAPYLSRLELDGPALSIPSPCAPLSALTHVKFHCAPALDDDDFMPPPPTFTSLFQCCPNLVALEIRGVTEATKLPPGPVPPTLDTVSLHGVDGHPVSYGLLLEAWTGCPIRQLELHGSRTLAHPLGLFLSSSTGSVEIEMLRAFIYLRQVASVDQAPCQHVVYPFSWHNGDQLRPLRGANAARLTSLSVYVEHLGEVFRARLRLPQLSTFEFQLNHRTPIPVPDTLPDPDLSLAAPRLRHVGVKVPDTGTNTADPNNACALAILLLCDHLRDLVQYDAAVLHRIVVRGPRKVLAALPCAQLAPLTTTYVEQPYQYT